MRESHDVYLVTDDNAGSGVVRELGIMGVTESLEEAKGAREVSDGQVDEDFGVHGGIYFPVLILFFPKAQKRNRPLHEISRSAYLII
jgi:hypothetical protein